MKKKVFILMLFLLPIVGFSQRSAEFTISLGGTLTDIETLVEEDEVEGSFASDWGTFSYGISGQYFHMSIGKLSFGAELMYQHLYWYSVNVPYGTQTIYRDYSVSAFRISPILRYEYKDNIAFDVGPEFNFLNGLKLGLMLSANYYIPITDKIDIPLKVRFDIMKNIVMTVPVSFNAGIRLKL